ncbi:hypothetical protein BT93_E2240 [Corymbia citriodora subsp. variegata]|nr:hypothetical protein BT93_E2240 [Corymbia citriodora subsp. variegata]
MAEWNPEKESLATVTEDSKVGCFIALIAEAVDNLSRDISQAVLHTCMAILVERDGGRNWRKQRD